MSQKDKSFSAEPESFSRLQLTAVHLEYVLKTLKEALTAPMQANRLNIDGSIQRFEYTIELFWKFLKRLLESEGIEALSPKQVLREAYAVKFISNEHVWLNMQNDRNQTSHTYNLELADQIYARLKIYYPLMHSTFQELKKEYL